MAVERQSSYVDQGIAHMSSTWVLQFRETNGTVSNLKKIMQKNINSRCCCFSLF